MPLQSHKLIILLFNIVLVFLNLFLFLSFYKMSLFNYEFAAFYWWCRKHLLTKSILSGRNDQEKKELQKVSNLF